MATATDEIDTESDLRDFALRLDGVPHTRRLSRVALLGSAAAVVAVGLAAGLLLWNPDRAADRAAAPALSGPSSQAAIERDENTATSQQASTVADVPTEADVPSEGNARSVIVEPAVVPPDGVLTVTVQCFDRPEIRERMKPVLFIEFPNGTSYQTVAHDPFSVEWVTAGGLGFVAQLELRQQVAPGDARVFAGCDDTGATSTAFMVEDYIDGPSWYAAEPLRWSLVLSSGKPFVDAGGTMTVNVSCKKEAGVGNGHVAFYRFTSIDQQLAFVGGERLRLIPVPADAYVESGDEITFEITVDMDSDLIGESHVRPSCITRPGVDPPSRHLAIETQSVQVTVE